MIKKMKKAVLVFIVASFFQVLCFSQDIITLKTGEQIRSRIIEVGKTDVRYRKLDNLTGPVYVTSKSDIAGIKYENGSVDTFNGKTVAQGAPELTSTPGRTVNTANPSGSAENSRKTVTVGFSGIYPSGVWPSTALTNMGTASYLKDYGHTLKRYGMGVIIQADIAKNFSLFFDGNIYDYNILLAKQGETVQSAWTEAEGATHWDEPGAPQTLVVNNLPTDVHFDMSTSGLRLGAKYSVGNGRVRPWGGAAFGIYSWTVNYFNGDKTKTYGKDTGYTTGFTFLLGIDFEIMQGIFITPFADLAAPPVNYHIDKLFYDQWSIDYEAPVMGTSRFGLTISFDAGPKKKAN